MGLAQRAWDENNVVRARELLAEVPREAAGRSLRGFEWFYLSRVCHPDELTLAGHAGYGQLRGVQPGWPAPGVGELRSDGEDLG